MDDGAPRPCLRPVDVVAVIVGLVIGAGIFNAPAVVAGNVPSGRVLVIAWLAGGLVSLVGALCYAELASAYPADPPGDLATVPDSGGFGLAMVFVLPTYGGWNEAAYVSAELHDVRRNMSRVLVAALVLVGLVYLLVNIAYLNVLGLHEMSRSEVVAARWTARRV